MPADVLLGLQWGDEGKGKVVDFLAKQYDIVARFQGGPNAGHTLEFDGIKHVLHQIPSGIFHDGIQNVIGNGVVLDPITFEREIKDLEGFGLKPQDRLVISSKAQIIVPTHKLLDKALEQSKGDDKIGSTLRGIGPTYQDKIGRTGLRVGDIYDPDFESKYNALKEKHLITLSHLGFEEDFSEDEAKFFASLDTMRSFDNTNAEYLLNDALTKGQSILAEGAQGAMLDIDHGTYPFVTSSNTITAGACTGLGIAPSKISDVIGIFKSYCTRVGSGPFPTELLGEDGEQLRKQGHEFGATTGRPRRCGWLDIPALKYSVMLNGVTKLYMMKADVLSGFESIKACESYLYKGVETQEVPYELKQDDLKPVYKDIKGWTLNTEGIESFSDLPLELRDYISYIENHALAPVELVSYGPDRKETVALNSVEAQH